nr:TMEM175 family protein [Kineosphaera limosa]
MAQGEDVERTVFFSDAVFAIALTVLTLDLRLDGGVIGSNPEELAATLAQKLPSLLAFILSFVLIGGLWLQHHRRFKAIERYDVPLQIINLTLLFFVVFLPVPTAMLFDNHGSSALPAIVYAACLAGCWLSLDLLWWQAWRRGYTSSLVTPAAFRRSLLRSLPGLAVLLVSIPLCLLSPTYGPLAWLLLVPAMLLPARLMTTTPARKQRARAG